MSHLTFHFAVTIVAMTAVTGCKKGGEKPSKCRKGQIEGIDRYVAQLCRAAYASPRRDHADWFDLRLATATRPPTARLPEAPLVILRKDGVRVRGEEVKEGLAKPWRLHAKLKQAASWKQAPHLHLAIEPDVPLSRVALVLGHARAVGARTVHFLVRPARWKGTPPPVPADQPYHRLTSKTDMEKFSIDTASRFQKELQQWSKTGCSAMTALYKALGDEAPRGRCKVVAERFAKAVKRCGCRADEKPLLAIWHQMFQPYDPLGAWHGKPNRLGKKLKADPRATWQTFVGRLVELRPGSDFWIHAPDPRVEISRFSVTGDMDKATVDQRIRAQLSGIRACYLAALKKSPRLRGDVQVTFSITPKGQVGRAHESRPVEFTPLHHPSTEKCIRDVIRAISFPRPKGALPFVSYIFRCIPE